MKQRAIEILDAHRTMAISTLRPDGWPQTTIVGYANDGFDVFFMVFRSSQKFSNIWHDNRVAIAVGEEPKQLEKLTAVYAGAVVREVTDPKQRAHAWSLLRDRHPNLPASAVPEGSDSALMVASCKYVSVLDYTQGLGHSEELVVGGESGPKAAVSSKHGWGSAASAPAASKASFQ